jgi:hypothetical protein
LVGDAHEYSPFTFLIGIDWLSYNMFKTGNNADQANPGRIKWDLPG